MNTEIWKDVSGYEGLYQVSNLGRVKSDRRVLKNYPNNRGYVQIQLRKDGKRKSYLVHRLVAEAFCVKSGGCDVVNHIDNDPTNNTAKNLEWVTQTENVRFASGVGKFVVRPVVRTDGKVEKQYPSICATVADGFTKSCVCECCQGKRKTYGGYVWRYANETEGV